MKVSIFAAAVLCLVFISCGGPSEEEIWSKADESQKKSDVRETLKYYQLLIEKYPASAHVPEALWKSATIYSNELKDFPAAVRYYTMFYNRYPDHRDAPVALFLTGFIYNNEIRNIDSARAYYSEFVRKYPAHELSSSVQYELGHLGKEAEAALPPLKEKGTAKKRR